MQTTIPQTLSRLTLIAALASPVAASVAAAAQTAPLARPAIAPPEAWVSEASVPAAPAAAAGAATIDLLSDTQVRLGDKGDTTYSAAIYRIATAQGLDSGALQVSWDPALESVTLHRYRIRRAGQIIDLLGDGSKLTVVRREKQLESAVLDGRLTASLQPDDLRVGDEIDVAYTLRRADPAMAGHSELLTGPADGASYGRYRLRVLWDNGKPVRWHAMAGVVQPRLIKTASGSELLADLSNVTTPRGPSDAPPRYQLVNSVEVAQFADWAAVSRTFAPFFAAAETLPTNSPLHAEAARIMAATPDPLIRAGMALQLVQQQVRYVFLAMDDGGFIPAPADLTWQRRFGDCKAKTALLTALLTAMGIDARPVLVNTERGDITAARLPAMAAFDHAIVTAHIGGRNYWLDGTRLGDSDLARLRTPNYVVGLPVTAAGSSLVPLVPEPLTEPGEVTTLALDASRGIEVPASASGEMRFHGDAAATMRQKYDGLSADDLTRTLRELWRKTYDFITPDAVTSAADPATGDFVLAMRGTAKMDWYKVSGARFYELDRARIGWKFTIARDGELTPEAPFAFEYPDWWANRETIILPDHGRGFSLQGEDVDRTVGGIFRFQRKIAIADGVVTLNNQTQALKGELPAADAPRTRDEMAALADGGAFVRVPDAYMATDADMAAIAGDRAATALAYAHRGAVHIERGEIAACLTDEGAALAIDGHLAQAHGVLALCLAMQGDVRADAEADAALTLDPGQLLAWKAKATSEMRIKNYDGAARDYTSALALRPGDSRSLAGRASARFLLGQFAEALSDLDAAQAAEPGLALHAARAQMLAALNRGEEALAAIDLAVADKPEDRVAHRARAEIRARFGERDAAMPDADFLIAHGPAASDYLLRAQLWSPGDADKRQADIAAALALNPRSNNALLMRARLALEAGDLAHAESDLAAAHRIDPEAEGLNGLRMELMARRGKPAEGLALGNAFLARHPGNPVALNNLCWFKATQGINADSAIADYDAALRGSPELASSLYGRGLAWARKGDRNRALADIARARTISGAVDAQFARYGMALPDGLGAGLGDTARR